MREPGENGMSETEWNNKGVVLSKLGRHEEAIKALEKAIEINPQNDRAWFGKAVVLGELEKYEDAIKAYDKAIEIKPQDALTYSNLAEVFFDLGNLKDASQRVEQALDRDKNRDKSLAPALSLKARIKIEEKDYEAASELFVKAISLDAGNPLLLLWDAYANYLKAEFSLESGGKRFQEEVVAIIRNLERADTLSKEQKRRKQIRPHALYFLGCFYLKSKDIFAAKEKLEECTKLKSKSPIEASARELLGNIWNYQIRPPWWRWWLNAPLYRWPKRIGFFMVSLFIFALLLLHPFIPGWFPSLQVNWTLYVFLIALLIIILLFPSIERIRARDIEVELRSPPPFEPVLSPMAMEGKIKEIEAKYQ